MTAKVAKKSASESFIKLSQNIIFSQKYQGFIWKKQGNKNYANILSYIIENVIYVWY